MAILLAVAVANAQQPFITDDAAVTDRGAIHIEVFNQFDRLQRGQFPNLSQNTANFKINYGLPHGLEVDFDSPYLGIFRSAGALLGTSTGIGDTNLGLKWNFLPGSSKTRAPSLAATFYVEFPTGNVDKELGSGLRDYALNLIAQKHWSDKTRVSLNTGIVFSGNTTTGVLGIENSRGKVFTGGLSLLHDINRRWTVGGEVYGGYTRNDGLAKSQLQGMVGGKYGIREGMTLDFGLAAGK